MSIEEIEFGPMNENNINQQTQIKEFEKISPFK